jgi:hypothetical protein
VLPGILKGESQASPNCSSGKIYVVCKRSWWRIIGRWYWQRKLKYSKKTSPVPLSLSHTHTHTQIPNAIPCNPTPSHFLLLLSVCHFCLFLDFPGLFLCLYRTTQYETAIPASQRLLILALDGLTTGIGRIRNRAFAIAGRRLNAWAMAPLSDFKTHLRYVRKAISYLTKNKQSP